MSKANKIAGLLLLLWLSYSLVTNGWENAQRNPASDDPQVVAETPEPVASATDDWGVSESPDPNRPSIARAKAQAEAEYEQTTIRAEDLRGSVGELTRKIKSLDKDKDGAVTGRDYVLMSKNDRVTTIALCLTVNAWKHNEYNKDTPVLAISYATNHEGEISTHIEDGDHSLSVSRSLEKLLQ